MEYPQKAVVAQPDVDYHSINSWISWKGIRSLTAGETSTLVVHRISMKPQIV